MIPQRSQTPQFIPTHLVLQPSHIILYRLVTPCPQYLPRHPIENPLPFPCHKPKHPLRRLNPDSHLLRHDLYRRTQHRPLMVTRLRRPDLFLPTGDIVYGRDVPCAVALQAVHGLEFGGGEVEDHRETRERRKESRNTGF